MTTGKKVALGLGIFGIGTILLLLISAIAITLWGMGVLNTETQQANLVKTKQVDNHNEFDNMWKSIAQSANITEEQAKQVSNIIIGYAKERSNQGKGSLAAMVHEVVPNVDSTSQTFQNLMNVVNAKRDSWTMRQKELLDLNRIHNNTLQTMPGSFVCSLFGRKEIEVKIVTSDKTEKAFETGKDDSEVKLFNK